MLDTPIWHQGHCFSSFELAKKVLVRYEKQVLDLLQLLEGYDVEFTRAWCWLYQETEFFVSSLALGNNICR